MAHSLRSHYFHLVWSTKNRQPLITNAIREQLYPYLGGIIRNHKCIPIMIGGISDHIHILIEIKNQDQFSTLIKELKVSSTHWIHKNFSEAKNFAWQEGYASFSVSYSGVKQVKKYIESQESHHQHMSFEKEYLTMLQQCQIEYDNRFVLG